MTEHVVGQLVTTPEPLRLLGIPVEIQLVEQPGPVAVQAAGHAPVALGEAPSAQNTGDRPPVRMLFPVFLQGQEPLPPQDMMASDGFQGEPDGPEPGLERLLQGAPGMLDPLLPEPSTQPVALGVSFTGTRSVSRDSMVSSSRRGNFALVIGFFSNRERPDLG